MAKIFHKTLILKETCAIQCFGIPVYQIEKLVGSIGLVTEASHSSHFGLTSYTSKEEEMQDITFFL